MMRGRHSAAVAVREPSGDILLHEETLTSALYRSPLARWPFLRGLVLLWDMLVLGTRMMIFAANVAMSATSSATGNAASDEYLAPAAANAVAATAPPSGPVISSSGASSTSLSAPSSSSASAASAWPRASAVREFDAPVHIGGGRLAGALILSFGLAIGLFFLLPLGVVALARPWVGDGWLSLTLEGLIRLGLLLGYLYLIGRLADVQRVFQYHGAEHKTINAYEAGDPLDVAHVRRASRVHTRCGTGFLLIVVVVSIVVFALLGTPPLWLRLISRVALVPVIASIAYELLRLGAANYRFRGVRWLLAPGLALQGLTTREPDDGQMECAIAALERVLQRDGATALDRVV